MTAIESMLQYHMLTNISKISSGYLFFDIILILCFLGIFHLLSNDNIKNKIFSQFEFYKSNTIIFTANEKLLSSRYRALMFFISQNKDSSVKNLIENEVKKYNSKTDRDEIDETGYIVLQSTKFIVDKKLEIFGRVFTKSQKKYDDYYGQTKYDEKHVLEISSRKLSLLELQEWVDEKEKEHKKILKNKLLGEQMLIEISYNSKEKTIESIYNPWHSNATFDNRFFSGKEEIVNKINFFINNEQYFKDKGIPYTLGILLYGEPGCGKTGFIKSILNLTKRHGVKFNLSNKFDFTLMRDIIYDEEIHDNLIIPQNKRIFIFEDIDAMGDAVKDRDLKTSEEDEQQNQEKTHFKLQETIIKQNRKLLRKKSSDFDVDDLFDNDNNNNNNLSYLLNILDGLQECPGRIIIMTTNKPEYLDKALIRPGRIDYNIHMTKATVEDIKNMLNHWWKDSERIQTATQSGGKDSERIQTATKLITNNKITTIPEHWEQKLSHADIMSICRVSDNINMTLLRIKNKIESDIEIPISPIIRPRYATSPEVSESPRYNGFTPINLLQS